MALATDEIVTSPVAAAATTTATTFDNFPRFDVVAYEPSDHFYFKKTRSRKATAANVETIMRERELLKRFLPDSIFVRVYGTRISLLRAAIVGAPGTPYHNFIFFFDIYLPSRYPSKPPKVFYRSFGVKGINPAFHEQYVCLDLLDNTRSRKRSERWDPKSSTILQVLLSIQSMLLVEEPYYNHDGGLPSGKNRHQRWTAHDNVRVFELCCIATINMLKDPPRYFEALVIPHFRRRGSEILTTWDIYHVGRVRSLIHTDVSWQMSSEELHWNIASALAKNGAPVGHFVDQAEAMMKTRKTVAEKSEDKRKDAIKKYIIWFIIKCVMDSK